MSRISRLLLALVLSFAPSGLLWAQNNGTYTGGVTLGSRIGIPGDSGTYAPSFDGSTGYVSAPSGVWFSGGDWSVEYWLYYTSWGGGIESGFAFEIGPGYTNLVANEWYGAGATDYVYSLPASASLSNPALPTNQWVYIVHSYDSATSTVSLYENAAFITSGTLAAPLNVTRNQNAIGGDIGLSRFWNGSLAQLAIYNRKMGPAEVSSHWSTGSSSGSGYPALIIAASPLAYWRLAETTGTSARDEMSGTGPKKTIVISVYWPSTGSWTWPPWAILSAWMYRHLG